MSGIIDTRPSYRPDAETYSLPGECSNCDWRGTLLIEKGREAPGRRLGRTLPKCPYCGCESVRAGRQPR